MNRSLRLALTMSLLAATAPLAAQGPAATLLPQSLVQGPPSLGAGACAGGEIYDDGGAENGYSGNPATVSSMEAVMQFTPASYPFTYSSVCVGLVSLGGPNLDFEIEVRDDDGGGGTPGTLLGALPTSAAGIPGGLPCTFYTVDISSLALNIPSGNVWIGVRWNPMLFPSRFVCADQSPATPLQPGYMNFNLGGGWQATQSVFVDYRAKLIRAVGGPAGTDVAITKTGVEGPLGTVVYTVTVTNTGADTTNVVVSDAIPAQLSYVSDDCGGTNTPPWTWNVGALANGANAVCNITTSVVTPGLTTNTATVTHDLTDTDPANDSSSVDIVTVGVSADLAMAKTGLMDPVGTVVYTLTATNNGPSNATGVTVTDTFPAELTYVSDDCGGVNGTPWTWTIGNLANGANAVCLVTLTVNVPGPVAINNTATVGGNEPDPNAVNNSATATLVVEGVPSVLEIPTLGGLGLATLVALLAGLALFRLRRRNA